MALDPVYASRVMRLPLLDADGSTIGRISDVVLVPPYGETPPHVSGFVAAVQRRRIFVNVGRVGGMDAAGVRLRSAAIDVRAFEQRRGEILASALLDRRVGTGQRVTDLALLPSSGRSAGWVVTTVALGGGGLRRRAPTVVPWTDVRAVFETGDVPNELAAYREMHPSDVATEVIRLPLERRRQLAALMDDERLAELLEELDEDEQLRLVEGLDTARVAHVLEEMDPDDAADLLGEMSTHQQRELLAAMAPDEAGPLRRLLRYGEETAGGLMTPEPVVLLPTHTVAQALARLRDPELSAALAGEVFITDPPTTTPTGRYLGSVGFQRLLREPPSMKLGNCVDDEPPVVNPTTSEAEVAAQLAAYDLLAVAVCDEAGRLLGAVSIDDVLDAVLPEGWRALARLGRATNGRSFGP